jgi:metal-dependent amidase/aminoacylase/carboxypeptidase family protein
MASEVVLFGDPEAAAISWLNPRLEGVEVSTEVPIQRPDELVKVSLTGGSDPNIVTELAQLTFECWAADSVRASDIARQVKALVRAMAGRTVNGIFVRSVRTVGGVVSFEDPETSLPRYQYTAELSCRYQSLGEA